VQTLSNSNSGNGNNGNYGGSGGVGGGMVRKFTREDVRI